MKSPKPTDTRSVSTDPVRLTASKHHIDPNLVDAGAISVVEGLRAAGYEALLVGGCVRDLMLGLTPKDFDVATSATPEQVKQVFRRARLIGRRFRIAHVRFGRDIVEVSTFRRQVAADEPPARGGQRNGDVQALSAQGMLLRDNAWGTLKEDAFRRDFTVNALYYDPLEQTVIDYTGGVADLRNRRLRLIGVPDVRYREDPVRILRALRFAGKLGFGLEEATAAGIANTVHLIGEVAPARLFDEICKLFLHGHAENAWHLLVEWDLLGYLFPDVDPAPHTLELIEAAMRGTDRRIQDERPVTPGFLIAVLLWDVYLEQLGRLLDELPPEPAREAASSNALAFQAETMAIPKRISQFVREVWMLQPRLEARLSRNVERLVQQQRFRAAYDFLLLRAETGEIDPALAQWWTDYQAVDAEQRAAMRQALPNPKGARKKRPRRPRKRSKTGQTPGHE